MNKEWGSQKSNESEHDGKSRLGIIKDAKGGD